MTFLSTKKDNSSTVAPQKNINAPAQTDTPKSIVEEDDDLPF